MSCWLENSFWFCRELRNVKEHQPPACNSAGSFFVGFFDAFFLFGGVDGAVDAGVCFDA